jgi:hypothetical protein
MSLASELRKEVKAKGLSEQEKKDKEAELEKANEKWRLDKFIKEELPKLPQAMKKYAREYGKNEYSIHKSEREKEYTELFSKFAEENGLKFKATSEWCRAESPDPDSGEGGNKAGPVYIFTFSW